MSRELAATGSNVINLDVRRRGVDRAGEELCLAAGPVTGRPAAGNTPPATRSRWQRIAHSPFTADLRDRAFLIGRCVGVLLAYGLADLAVAFHNLIRGATP